MLHIALSAGLSALKTPTCHSIHNTLQQRHQTPNTSHNNNNNNNNNNSNNSNNNNNNNSGTVQTLTGSPVCPICSTELNELARNVPYAHHTKSYMEEDPVVLPNGRVFGRERLRVLNEKLGVKKGRVRDPTDGTGEEWGEGELKKVYIS